MRRMYHIDIENMLPNLLKINGHFLYQIKQLSLTDFVLIFSHKHHLFFSLNNETPFLAYLTSISDYPDVSENHLFLTEMRKALGGELLKVVHHPPDVIVDFVFVRRNDNFTSEEVVLRLELIAHHPQALIINATNKITAAFRYTYDLSGTKRHIRKHFPYEFPLLAQGKIPQVESLNFYEQYLTENRKRLQKVGYRDLYVYLEKESGKKRRLIKNLQLDLAKSTTALQYYDAASALLLAEKEIKDSHFMELPINPALTNIQNANLLFKKGKKLKASRAILQSKIDEVVAELAYLTNVLLTLPLLNDKSEIEEIREELHLVKASNKRKAAPKAYFPYFLKYEATTYYFGKNNKQNDYLTFNYAPKNATFFHIHNQPGSHIIILTTSPTKREKEVAGMLALLLSNVLDGEISYSLVKNIKKGPFPGSVIFREHQTFYLKSIEESVRSHFQAAHRLTK